MICADKLFQFSGPTCIHLEPAGQGPMQGGPGYPGILPFGSWVQEFVCLLLRPHMKKRNKLMPTVFVL